MITRLAEKSPGVLRPKKITSEVHTAVPVSKLSINIQIKVPEPKAFDGKKKVPNPG